MDERWPLKGPEPPDFGGHMPNHSEFPPENVEVMRRVGKFAYGCSNMKAALMWVNQARTESGLKIVSIGTLKYYLNKIAKANNFLTRDIKEVECGKWAHLHITLKDGRIITEDGCTYGEVDMKWASEEHLYDENYGELI